MRKIFMRLNWAWVYGCRCLILLCLGPKRTGRWLGRVPYFPVAVEPFIEERFPLPKVFDQKPSLGIPSDGTWDQPKVKIEHLHYVARVKNGFADFQGCVFNENFRPIHGACHAHPLMEKYRRRLWKNGIETPYFQETCWPQHFNGKVLVATQSSQHTYTHWLLDILPRVGKILAKGEPFDYLYIQHSFPFQLESLKYLGITVPILPVADYSLISGDELIVPCHQIAWNHHHPEWVINWVRNTFLPKEVKERQFPKRIFISRARARVRRLLNEDEIFKIVSPLDFECVVLEDLPFCEQVALFQQAECIVSPHGSGLANLIFCHPGTKVLELFPSFTVDHFYRVSTDVGLEYAFVKTRVLPAHRRANEDFAIEPADLMQGLQFLRIT